MNTNIQEQSFASPNITAGTVIKKNNYRGNVSIPRASSNVAFKGLSSNASKHFWLGVKRLSGQMKEITEFTNAIIAAIGTGIIAPPLSYVVLAKGTKKTKIKKRSKQSGSLYPQG